MFYIFHGDDEHSQKKTLAELQKKLGDPGLLELNTSRFQGSEISTSRGFAALKHACDSIPFLADKRLVLVTDLLSQKPLIMDDLLAYLPRLPETTRLVFLESKPLAGNHPLIRFAQTDESGYVKLFARPQGSQLERWIREQVKAAGGQIAPHAAHLLAVNAGNDLRLLGNEIEKLVLYKGKAIIEADDVSTLCPYVAEASVFELVDAIGTRHSRSAARLLHKKLSDGSNPFQLFAMVVRQFRLLIQVKELAEAGTPPGEIASKLKLHGFVAGKLNQQSRNFTADQLKMIYAHLLSMDVGAKTGQTDMTTALNLFVAGVTT